jgi:signal transduction histidine kinase
MKSLSILLVWLAIELNLGSRLVAQLALVASTTDTLETATNELPLITTARRLLELPPKEVDRRYPVQLRGTISYFDPDTRTLFARDETSGFWIFPSWSETNTLHFGQVMEVTGITEGPNVPGLRPLNLRVFGDAPLPPPTPVTYERMASGKLDCQWLELEGVVRTLSYYHGLLRMVFVADNVSVPLYFPNFRDQPLPAHLVGARIQVRGVCSMGVAPGGRVTGAHLFVQSLDLITVLRAAATNAFDEPLRAVKDLSLYWTHVEYGERIKVAGNVTLWRPPDELYIRDRGAPLAVRLRQPWPKADPKGRYLDPVPVPPLKPGDGVEVVGFAADTSGRLWLDAAECRLAGSTDPPAPMSLEARDAVRNELHGELISVQGEVLNRETRIVKDTATETLLLQSGPSIFQAELVSLSPGRLSVPQQSIVRVSGINTVQSDAWNRPRSFRVLMRDASDVTLLKPPPHWTLLNAARLGGVASGVILIGLIWIAVLRRRVARRTAELATSNTRLHAEVEERKRAQSELARALDAEKELSQLKSRFVSMVSHEFRTPLGVILSSADLLSDYRDTLTPAESAEQLADIKQSTRHMADLMEDVLVLGRFEAGTVHYQPVRLDLLSFCQRLVDEILSATDRACPVVLSESNVSGSAYGDETLLRHVLLNLLSNAVKYSSPGQTIQFRVERAGDDAVFTVLDEGIGIPPEEEKHVFDAFFRGKNVGERPGSGLGLVIVKRCVELQRGNIKIAGVEGRGTTVIVRLPLFAQVETGSSNRNTPAQAAPIIH